MKDGKAKSWIASGGMKNKRKFCEVAEQVDAKVRLLIDLVVGRMAHRVKNY